MAPIRRYLRITPHTALEARIYLDNPGDAAWLLKASSLDPSDTPLSRIVKAVQPLVLPKLREENTRMRTGAKGKKARGVKDTVSGDDFEASAFLVESGSRHAILVRHRGIQPERLEGRKKRWDFNEWRDKDDDPVVIREEDDDDDDAEDTLTLADYPDVRRAQGSNPRNTRTQKPEEDPIEVSDDEGFTVTQAHAADTLSESGTGEANYNEKKDEDDKKKLGLSTRYDGFSIYGRILCLIVKRRGARSRAIGSTSSADASAQEKGRQMLESWVSTQAQRDIGAEEVE